MMGIQEFSLNLWGKAFTISPLSMMFSLISYIIYSLVPFHPTVFPWTFLVGTSSDNERPQLLFIWECLNFSLILKDSFASYRILGWQIVFFSAFNISTHYLLTAKVLDENFADDVTGKSLMWQDASLLSLLRNFVF